MSTAKPWPVADSELVKGATFDLARLEEILGMRRAATRDNAWNLAVLELAGEIATMYQSVHGVEATVKCPRHEQIVICADDEASERNDRSTKGALRRMIRSHRRNLAVEVTKLSPERVEEHARNLHVNGRMIHAAISARREVRIEPVRSDKPALVPKKED